MRPNDPHNLTKDTPDMRCHLLASSLALLVAGALPAAEEGVLIHWSFNEGSGAAVKDQSGNGLDGTVKADWVDSPAGKALLFDGSAAKIVSVQIPPEQRFGKDSWSFMAMLKPVQFTIEDRQNQRRVFAYGTYPGAYLVIDLMGNGSVSCYFCYKADGGRTVSTGAGSAFALKTGEWAHVALVCDRAAKQINIYINGYAQGSSALAAEFDGDFAVSGDLELGNGWHNYWGAMDEVKVYRRALSRAEVRAEFKGLQATFQVAESAEAAAAEEREALSAVFAQANAAWGAGDFAAARAGYGKVLTAAVAPAHFRSYAHLRLAQSYAAEGKAPAARAEYERIAAEASYPEVHRYEAGECVQESDRVARGLPARDPMASRTQAPKITAFAAEVYVAPEGDDAQDGSAQRPFATLARARDAVRALKADGVNGPIGVRIRSGEYTVTETLALTAADSGTETGPVVYRAEELGKAVFYGGARLSGFGPVTDRAVLERLPEEARGKVVQCDLRALGITDYGELRVRGFGQPAPPPTLELYVNGQPMTLARWPNEGFVRIKALLEPGSKATGKPAAFEYDSERHARWTQAEDAWLFGYFRYLWADAAIKVGAIDTTARTLTTAEAYQYGGGMDAGQGIIYYAFNLLEEIDRPGEWYLHRGTGILYLYPPADLGAAVVEIGMLPTPMVTLAGVAHVRFEGLVFDLARGNGMVITDSEYCRVAGCTVKRLAGNGIMVNGGSHNMLLGCDLHTIGRRATEVSGGDRQTLTPGGHVVENCRIHNFGRIDRTYTPAIQLEGVSNRVAHNLMYDCPSSVMRIEGNDHLIEFNEVHSAVQESDDQGAMELFRNPTYRGVIFRYNRIHHVGKTGSEGAVHGQAGIRFDDAISGMLVYGNIFYRSANGNFGAIQMNSGRDNIMDNNIFADCKQGVSGGWNPGNSVWKLIQEGKAPTDFFTTELYLSRYPALAQMMEPPGLNHIWRNVFYRCGRVTTGNQTNLVLLDNGGFDEVDPGFVDAAAGDFRLKPDAKLLASLGFKPIPVDEIGLYADPYRATWPVLTTPVPLPDWRPKASPAPVK
jgi:hypothetical protein